MRFDYTEKAGYGYTLFDRRAINSFRKNYESREFTMLNDRALLVNGFLNTKSQREDTKSAKILNYFV